MSRESCGEIKVDQQTIQWARESLQRRRIDLLKEKKNLISCHKQIDDDSTSSVHAMLEKGRALLSEAEAHSNMLGQRMFPGKIDGDQHAVEASQAAPTSQTGLKTNDSLLCSTEQGFMTSFLREMPPSMSEELHDPVEVPLENEFGENDMQLSQITDENEILQELLQEGDARARLDDLISTIRRQGGDALPKQGELVETPKKGISNFDPSSLKSARRAALKKIAWDAEVAASDKEARLCTSFKALPLPGGVEVKNNLFASTQAFQGKLIGSVEQLVRRDSKYDQLNDRSSSISGTFGECDGISVVSRTTHNDSFTVVAHENDADRERAKHLCAEKKRKKRQLLDTVNQIIAEDTQAPINDDCSVFSSEGNVMVEDPSKLRQDIARLEAKLKQKRTERLAILNDIVDIDLDAIFDRLHSGESDGAKYIIDRLKNQICGNLNDFPTITDANTSVTETREQRKKSLFRRHEEWSKEREQKLIDVRLQLEADTMHGITGAPELSRASRSWQKAKESHEEALKRATEEEQKQQQEKGAREKAEAELKLKEMENLQEQANSKLKSIKSHVNKEEQRKRLEALSQPRQVRESINVEALAESGESPILCSKSEFPSPSTPRRKIAPMKFERSKTEEKPRSNLNTLSDRKPNEYCGKPSFSDLSDKDFAALVKRISKRAQKNKVSAVDAQVQIIENPETMC